MQTLTIIFASLAALYLITFALMAPRAKKVIKGFDLSKATPRKNKDGSVSHIFPHHSHEASVLRGMMYATMLSFGALATLGFCAFVQLLIWIF
jgi:hypothetical protein